MSNILDTPRIIFPVFSELVDLKEKIKEKAIAYLTDIYKGNEKNCGVDMHDNDNVYHKVVFYNVFAGKDKTSMGLTMVGNDLFFVKYTPTEGRKQGIEMVYVNQFGGDVLIELVYLVEKKFQN